MSNGIVKVKEEYIDEAKIEAEGLISENYAFFKNKLTGFITSSTIGIEIYKEIITEELKYVLAIEKSVAGLGKEVIIDEDATVHPKWDVKELISKYESALKEGMDEDSVKKKDADYSLRIRISDRDFRIAQADLIRAITELRVATKYKRKPPRPTEV